MRKVTMKAGEQNQTCYGLLQPLDSTCIGLTGSRVRSFTLGTGLEAGNDFPVDQNSSYFQGMIFDINLTHIKKFKAHARKVHNETDFSLGPYLRLVRGVLL